MDNLLGGLAGQSLGNLVVRVGLDGSDFDRGLKNVNARLAVARTEMRANTSEFGKYGSATDKLRVQQDGLAKMYDLQGTRVKQLRSQYDELVKTHGEESEAAMRAAAKVNQAVGTYNNMGHELQEVTKELVYQESAWSTVESGLSGFSNTTGKLADGFGNAGRKMTVGLTLPIVGVGTAALKTGMDFEASMSKVQALTGATGVEMEAMTDQAKHLGETTIFSASQAAEGMAFLGMAGWDTKEIMAGMPGLLDLAAAGAMDLGRAADIASNIMSGFAIDATEAGRVSDILAHAASNSNTNLEQLGEAMKYVAPMANTLGISIEDSAAAMMGVADAGLQGSMGGRAFATSLTRLAQPTSKMQKEMKKLNLSFFDSEGAMKPLPEIIEELEKATDGMTDKQQAATLSTLFGAEAQKHWAVLLSQGSEKLHENSQALSESEGSAERMAKTMTDNARGAVIEFKSALEGVGIALSEHMIPAVTDAVKWATDLVRKFGSLDKDTQKYILTAAGVAAVLGPAAIVLSTTLRAVSHLSGGLAKAVGAYGRYSASAKVAQANTTKFGNSAMLAGTQVTRASGGMGRFSRGLGGIGTAASLAGAGMLVFGDDSQQGLGTALLFGPEILKLGKGLVRTGGRAVESGGKLLGLGKNASTASKGIGTLARGVGTFGSRAAALGGPVGVGIAAIAGLGYAGYEVYEHYQDKVLPTIDSFGDIVMENGEKISESTAEQLDAFKTLSDEAMVEINKLSWGSQEVTDKMADSLTGKFSEMGTMIRDELNKNYSQSQQDLEKFLGQSETITDEHQVEIQKRYEDYYNARISHTEEMEGRINEIIKTAADENRTITDDERAEINRIKDSMMEANVRAVSEGSLEQKAILEQLKTDSSAINAEQAADTVKKSVEARDGAVKAANERYDEVVKWAITQRDETGLLTEEEATKIIREAGKSRDDSIKAAEDMHKGVVKEARLQAEEHIELINWQTGDVKSAWELMMEDLLRGWNWLGEQINKVLRFFGSDKEVPTMESFARKNKKKGRAASGGGSMVTYRATGTPASGHPEDGWAVVSEVGPELIHDPVVGTYVTAANGPEMRYLHKGASVLPAHHTKDILSRYGFAGRSNFALPAYEKGVGEDDMSWWESMLAGPKALMQKAASGLGDWVHPNFLKFGKGVMSEIASAAVNFVTNLMPSFGFGGSFPSFPQPPFVMTSGYGPRRSPGGIGSTNHRGIDYAAPIGTPIPSQSAGRVSFAGWMGGYGNLVKISSGIYDLLYGHNQKNMVKRGQSVNAGQTIALVGSTGNSTGPHVHFEVRKNGAAVNPKSVAGELSGGGGIGGVKVGGNVTNWIAAAMRATGVSGKAWLEGLSLIAKHESNGNPRAINRWDSNYRRGTPSMGLMQVIEPTFRANMQPGMGNIMNPVHNTAAAINYINRRYGGIHGVPGVKAVRSGRKYVGYATGARITEPQIAAFVENGWPEYAITTEPAYRERSLSLYNQLGRELGVPEQPSVSGVEQSNTSTNSQDSLILKKIDGLIQSIKQAPGATIELHVAGEKIADVLGPKLSNFLGMRTEVQGVWE